MGWGGCVWTGLFRRLLSLFGVPDHSSPDRFPPIGRSERVWWRYRPFCGNGSGYESSDAGADGVLRRIVSNMWSQGPLLPCNRGKGPLDYVPLFCGRFGRWPIGGVSPRRMGSVFALELPRWGKICRALALCAFGTWKRRGRVSVWRHAFCFGQSLVRRFSGLDGCYLNVELPGT